MGADCLLHSAVFTSICSYGNQQELVIPTCLYPLLCLPYRYLFPIISILKLEKLLLLPFKEFYLFGCLRNGINSSYEKILNKDKISLTKMDYDNKKL